MTDMSAIANHGGPSPVNDADSFLYHVTHDLKTYLRALRVIPEWVAEDLAARDMALPEEVRDNLDLLTAYVAGMDRMLNGLTELSRVGRMSDPVAAHALAPLAATAWADCGADSDMDFVCTGDGVALGPLNDLTRVFKVLLSNAVIFNDAERGAGVVRVRIDSAGDRLRIAVEDNGPGVPAAYRARVFEPLQTLQPKDSSGTAGIGLAVARKVVEMMGGRIGIEGANPRGCRVVFDLPQG